jgi:Tol biopolymer transport system component
MDYSSWRCEVKEYTFLGIIFPLLFLLTACNGTSNIGAESTSTPNSITKIAVTETSTPTNMPTATLTDALTPTAIILATTTPTLNLGQLAYIKGGDIWVKALPSGKPQQLTTDGQNDSPCWSPSGQWLAFRKGQQVWVIRADGSAAHPLYEGAAVDSFAWAPLTDQLAYVMHSGELQVISAGGTAPITLVPQTVPERGPGRVDRITWSPNEAWLAYGWWQDDQSGRLIYHGLWKVSADGKKRDELYNSGAPEKGVAVLAGWSPTGEQVLFWQGDILSASLLADGTPLYSLLADQDVSENSTPAQFSPELMLLYPDFLAPAPLNSSWGTDDVVALVVGAGRETWTHKRIEVADRRLTTDDVVATSPAWSPDGQHIAYVAMPDRGDLLDSEEPIDHALRQRSIWIANAQGESQPRQLTDDAGYRDEWPLWSADGSHILFARLDSQERASLWLISTGGGRPQQVAEELTPMSERFDRYGLADWRQIFDWWRR